MCIASKTQRPMFRSLLLRRECCSFSNGEYVKAGLHELEQWCVKATDQVTGLSKCEFLQYKGCQVQDDIYTSIILYTVFWIVVGWTPTHKASRRISGKILWTQFNKVLINLINDWELTSKFFNHAGFASKISKITRWDHEWTLPGNLINLLKQFLNSIPQIYDFLSLAFPFLI